MVAGKLFTETLLTAAIGSEFTRKANYTAVAQPN